MIDPQGVEVALLFWGAVLLMFAWGAIRERNDRLR